MEIYTEKRLLDGFRANRKAHYDQEFANEDGASRDRTALAGVMASIDTTLFARILTSIRPSTEIEGVKIIIEAGD